MKKLSLSLMLILMMAGRVSGVNDAPVTTAANVFASGNTATIPVTVTGFTLIQAFQLWLVYDPSIATATNVALGTGVGGNMDFDITFPGIVSVAWYASGPITLSGNPVLLNITFSKVISGTTTLVWDNESSSGYLCYYQDGDANFLIDEPTANFYFNGSLTFGTPVIADFSATNLIPPKSTTVQFTDLSTGSPTSWTWSFNRSSVNYVNGTDATSQHPQVQFTEGGPYTVTLVASNGGSTDTETKTDYIRAGIPGVWTGASSTDWTTTTNWDDWLVPAASTDVIIPATAVDWPTYTGDFTLGSTCKSVTMNGASQATITGDFAINSGYSLVMNSNAVFRVGGNWTNAGNFSAGAGTVELYGTNPASIIGAGNPVVINNFYDLKVLKDGVTLTILPDIVVNGDLQISQ